MKNDITKNIPILQAQIITTPHIDALLSPLSSDFPSY
jgi:hypothetical protein